MCLLVCLSAFYRPHDICPLCGAASEWPRAGSAVAGGPARAGKHAQREHARASRTTSLRKNRSADAFQKQNRTRAHAVVYVTLFGYCPPPALGSRKADIKTKKLQPGGKPNSFAFRNPGRPRRSINCSRDGSRTASRFAIQVNRDGRSNCSQLGSRPSPANKPCPRRRDSRRSSGQMRRRSASDGCRKGR